MKVSYQLIHGFPGYKVGSDGSVWTCKNARWGLRDSWKQLRAGTDLAGYQTVALMAAGQKRGKTIRTSVLVLTAFSGERPEGFDACHNNGNPADNRLENLRWASRSENIKDSKIHGTFARGEKAGNCKLTEAEVIEMRILHNSGTGYKTIAKKFSRPFSTVVSAVSGRSWAHVTTGLARKTLLAMEVKA